MPAETADLIASLPPWAQAGATIVSMICVGIVGAQGFLKARREEKRKAEVPEHFDASELLSTSPVVKLLGNVEEIAVSLKLLTEAARNVSAVATNVGKLLESDYSELRVFKAVHEEMEREFRRREAIPRGKRNPRGSHDDE